MKHLDRCQVRLLSMEIGGMPIGHSTPIREETEHWSCARGAETHSASSWTLKGEKEDVTRSRERTKLKGKDYGDGPRQEQTSGTSQEGVNKKSTRSPKGVPEASGTPTDGRRNIISRKMSQSVKLPRKEKGDPRSKIQDLYLHLLKHACSPCNSCTVCYNCMLQLLPTAHQ